MLLFYAVPKDVDLHTVERKGLPAEALSRPNTFTDVHTAMNAGSGRVLVIDTDAGKLEDVNTDASPRVRRIEPSAIRNLGPYRPPKPVTAAGGYVACSLPDDVALLLIFRRGVWDLPKGKQDPDEDVERCARREVREEVGIERLEVLRPLGATQHAYPDADHYAVKTTHWFLMRTPERSFHPERPEGIQRVHWARWTVARRHIGYDNLRHHMRQVETDVRAALQ